jgi:hypothetical protein
VHAVGLTPHPGSTASLFLSVVPQGNQSPNKVLASNSLQSFCKTECSKCVAAAYDSNLCPSASSPLPPACSQGLQFNAMVKGLVDKCAGMYFAEPGSLSRTGC